jgi:NTE family protein
MPTAFVLSGGGSLGAVQVGMLLALADRHITPDLLVGSSVGALNAAFVAGRPGHRGLDDLAATWTALRRTDVFPTGVRRIAGAASGRVNGIADPRPLRRLVQSKLTFGRLEDAPWPLAVVGTEVTTGREVVLTEGPAVDAVMASAALPGVFPPVEVSGHLLMDGGVVNNSPISVAAALGATRVFVLPTGYACALETAPKSPLGMAMHAVTVAIQRRLVQDVQDLQSQPDCVDLRVAPPLCPVAVSPVDFRAAARLIERARAATRAWLDRPPAADQSAHLALHRHGPDHAHETTGMRTPHAPARQCA